MLIVIGSAPQTLKRKDPEMKKLIAGSLVLLFAIAMAAPTVVAKSKVVTLEGKILCAKCGLDQAESCQNVLIVEKKGKELQYFLTRNETYESYGEVCKGRPTVRVTGKVSKDDGQMWLTATEIEPVDTEG
jgi:hypothetical protein